MKKFLSMKTTGTLVLASFFMVAMVAGCGENNPEKTQVRTSGYTTLQTVPSLTGPVSGQAGIKLDPNLQSATGTPAPEEMKPLVELQAKVPYPVIVPTSLPGSYSLEADLIGYSAPSGRDPVGYYTFRYSDPGNESRILTFNQSLANSKPLSGYYLTEVAYNGTEYQVYWHRTRDYLPEGQPTRTVRVEDAETYVVVWKGSYTDAAGQPHELFYSMSTGTWTGHGWGDISNILESLKPLESVGG